MLILIIITVCSDLLLTRFTDIKYEIDTSYIVSQILLVLIPILTIFISIDADKKTIKAQLKIDQLQNIPNLNALLTYSVYHETNNPTKDGLILLLQCPKGEIDWTSLLMEIQNVNNVIFKGNNEKELIIKDDHQRMLARPISVERVGDIFVYRVDVKCFVRHLDYYNIELLLSNQLNSSIVIENMKRMEKYPKDADYITIFKQEIQAFTLKLVELHNNSNENNKIDKIIKLLIENKYLISLAYTLIDGVVVASMNIDYLEKHFNEKCKIDFGFYDFSEKDDYILLNYNKFKEFSILINQELKRLKDDL